MMVLFSIIRYIGAGGAVIIPQTHNGLPITTLKDRAFSSSSSVTSVTIPGSVTNIEAQAFYGCGNLNAIQVDERNPVYNSVDGVLVNKDKTVLIQCPPGKSGFYMVPDCVTSIGDLAFSSCWGLANVNIPASVAQIGTKAFHDCSKLSAIWINDLNPTYSSLDGVLYNKDKTILIKHPAGKSGDFIIPEGVAGIGDWALSYCYNLTGAKIPNSLSKIGANAFAGCTNLTAINITSGVTSIGDSAFYKCNSLKSMAIPDSVCQIGDSAFSDCTGLTNCTIGAGVTNIENNAFWNCSCLTSMTIPGNVSQIGTEAFRYCSMLKNVNIENGVKALERGSFFGCLSLTSITIPKSVNFVGTYAFAACDSLNAIMVDELNPAYSSLDGVLFNKDRTVLIQCPNGKTGFYITPGSVKAMGDAAFYSCSKLTSITITSGITNIPSAAFENCSSLGSITLPDGITSIEIFAFSDCTKLKGVYFYGDAPRVESYEFHDTHALAYYTAGSHGWTAKFGAIGTALWTPQLHASSANPGLISNQFSFTIAGLGNQIVVVEACTNLVNPVWIPVHTNTLISGPQYYNDPGWTNYPVRFYRHIEVQ